MQRETKKSGLARSVSLKGVRKAANSLKKATVDIVDKVGDKVGDNLRILLTSTECSVSNARGQVK